MALTQMDDFTFKHSGQLDAIYTQFTANQIKALFDSRGIELRTALNDLISILAASTGAANIGAASITDIEGSNIQAMLQNIRDKLKSTTDGTSGADYINATTIAGLTGTTVQSLLEALKTYIDAQTASDIEATPIASGSGATVQAQLAWLLSQIAIAATGSIPDGSLGEVKLDSALITKINTALSNTGVLTTLLTADKSSSVNAINEIFNDVGTHKTDNVKHITSTERTAWNAKQAALGFAPENTINKGQSNGYAGLGSDGKVPSGQLPSFSDGAWEKITDITLTSDTSQVDFQSLGLENYRYLKMLIGNTLSNQASGSYGLRFYFNNDTSAIYDYNDTGGNAGATYFTIGDMLNYTSIGAYELTIKNFPSSKHKSVYGIGMTGTNGKKTFAGSWKNTSSVINKITIMADQYSIKSGATFMLWGVK